MKYLSMFLLVLAVIYWLSERTPTQIIAAADIYVIDGDTIDISGERYRLVGYDTPETFLAEFDSEKLRGDQATARLRSLVERASQLTLDVQKSREKYGRRLGTLSINSEDVGDILVREGLARRYTGGQRQSWCSPR